MRWEEERKKQTTDETIIEMKPADYYLKVIKEYVIDIVWVNSEMDAIRYMLLLILTQAVSGGCSMFSYMLVYNIEN